MSIPDAMLPRAVLRSDLPPWLLAADGLRSGETSMQYLARHSHSFRYAARFLPPPYDVLVADVYAFCRFTDDLVDAAGDVPAAELRRRLEEWRELARRAYQGRAGSAAGEITGFPLLDRPIGEMARRGIPFELADDLIEGVGMDLEPRRYATLAELDLYSHRVASVVGLWLTRLVGVRDPAVLERAADLGLAMQLTNILRDVGEDRARGRLYLPLDVLARHGISADALMAVGAGSGRESLPPGWTDAMEELMAAAEARYARALEALPALPSFFRRPVRVSALVYRDIHRSLRRNRYDNLNRRAYVSRGRKAWLGIVARVLSEARPEPSAARGRVAAAVGVAALAGLLALSLGAAPPRGPTQGEAGEAGEERHAGVADVVTARLGSAEAMARRDLAAAEAALRRSPGKPELLLRRLRLLHALSVQDESLLASARAAREKAEAALGPSPLLLAYRGALEVVEARHGFWPRERMEPLRRGLPLLDSAVGLDPADAEIRYLRLTSGYYLPFFLGRKPQVREDFAALARLLPGARHDFPAAWYVAVTDFVLDKGGLEPGERERLLRARADVSAASKHRASGPDYSHIP